MAIDPSIPLSVRPPQVDVVGSMHRALQLQAIGQENQLRDLEVKQRLREAADDAAMREAMQGGDPDKAVEDLMKGGHATAGLKLSSTINQMRKHKWETKKIQWEAAEKQNEQIGQMLQGIKDDDSFQFAKKAIIGAVAETPEAAQALNAHFGDHYDPEKVKSLLDEHTKRSDLIRMNHYSVTEAQKALELMEKGLTNVPGAPAGAKVPLDPQAELHFTNSLANRLSLSTNQNEWAAAIMDAKGGGVPDVVLQKFPAAYTPENAARAAALAQTPAQRIAEQGAAETRAIARARFSEEQWRDFLNTGAMLFQGGKMPAQPGGPGRGTVPTGTMPSAATPSAQRPTAGAPAGGPTVVRQRKTGDLTPLIDPNLHGEELLKQLPPALASTVHGYAIGARRAPAGFALKSPYFQNLMMLVQQYDPTFDESRYKYRQDFLSPNSAAGKSIGALNTAVSHLDELSQMAEALHNNNLQVYNRLANRVATEIGWTGKTNYDMVAPQLAKEIERLWRGSGGSAGEIEQMLRDSLTSKMAPKQFRGAFHEAAKLIEGKLQSLEFQRDQALGPIGSKEKEVQVTSPQTRQILDRFEGKGPAPELKDLQGLTPGHARRFDSGPFAGQTWAVGPDGKPYRVEQ